MKKIIFIPAIILTFAVLASSIGCSARKAPAAAKAPVIVATAFATNLPVELQPPPVGHVMAYSTVTVHSQIQGTISKIYFKEGQEVKQGDPLFLIDPRPSEAALEQAQANLVRDSGQLEYQQANYARDLKLLESKIVAQNQIDTDKAGLDAATGTVSADGAAITNALLNVEFCHIDAPVDGIAGGLQSYVGNVVKAPDDTLVTINQIHPIYVQFAVPEQFLPEIKEQMALHALDLSVHFENMDVRPPHGQLTFIDNTVDTTTGTIQLRGTFANTNNALWPGQFVTVNLTLSQLTNAVVVPNQAVQTGQNGEFVYVVKSDQTAEERSVTIGIAYGEVTQIKSGLQAGEMVVTDGQLRLAPGTPVNVKSATAGNTNSIQANASGTNSTQ
ncbi:MAG TPA: efflux RND transporter periplasmic adaptor subunit [Verrucomicrobiae bacterium]|jgi:multidrug efflux system membrane fusion protein